MASNFSPILNTRTNSPNSGGGSGGMSVPGIPRIPGSGGSNNGLNLSGSWASGGFNTVGMPALSGWQQFSGTVPFNQPMTMPGSNFPAFQAPGLPGVHNPNQPFGFTGASFNPTNFPGLPGAGSKDLEKLYGKDIGGALSKFLSSGAGFNPAVMQAQLNEALPIEERTVGKMMDIFGTTGNAYSSTAALGIGDFESQFNSALQGQFAQEYQQSVQNYLNVLMGIAPSAQEQQAQKPNWMSIASEIASAIIPFF